MSKKAKHEEDTVQLKTSEKIKILCGRRNITLSQLAEKLETSVQNLSNKLVRDNFSEKELQQIAKALECKYESIFIFDDGEKI